MQLKYFTYFKMPLLMIYFVYRFNHIVLLDGMHPHQYILKLEN